MRLRTALGVAGLFILGTGVLSAQQPRTLNDFYLQGRKAVGAGGADSAADRVAKLVATTAADTVTAPVSAVTPDPFASRVHASYEDFFRLFAVAISSVTESADGQSLLVRLNFPTNLGVEAALTKPTLSQDVLAGIEAAPNTETEREAFKKALTARQSDTDDITLSVKYGLHPADCDLEAKPNCTGRDPELYRHSLERQLVKMPQIQSEIARITRAIRAADEGSIIPLSDHCGNGNGMQETPDSCLQTLKALPAGKDLSEVDAILRRWRQGLSVANAQAADLQALAEHTGKVEASITLSTEMAQLGEVLAGMIDRQPQQQANLSARLVQHEIGANEYAAQVGIQWGGRNLNKAKQLVRDGKETWESILNSRSWTNPGVLKFAINLNGKYRERYHVRAEEFDLPAGAFAPIDTKSTGEVSASIQLGAPLPTRIGERTPRLDLSGEYFVAVADDRRSKTRCVIKGTFSLPLGSDLTVPFSVTYANRPEFLTEARAHMGVHIGLSYRFPWEAH